MKKRKLQLLCMGRAAVDLYGQQIGASLENVSTFAKYVGGCPANIAIGTSRLGIRSGILSRVGDEAMGRFVRQTFIDEKVDTSHLKTDNDSLTALVLLGIDPPDRFPLIFYRENCADMAISEEDFSLETFQETESLLITGTHCSKEKIFEVTKKAVELAKCAGCKVILDIDYRPVLWGATGHDGGEERYVEHQLIADRLGQLLEHCDLVVGTEEEILAAAGENAIGTALSHLSEQTDAIIVQKRGELGCITYSGNFHEPIQAEPFSVEVMNVLGAGDAFMSGFLKGYLENQTLEECCRLGNANGALVVTRHGCSPAMPYWEELQAFINQSQEEAEKLHYFYNRPHPKEDLYFLAFDHRKYFEELNLTPEKITYFKNLIFEAVKEIKCGIIVDDQYGTEILKKSKNPHIARCIEKSHSFPLEFLEGKEASSILQTWPREHIVKVLVFVGDNQISKLKHLYQATQESGNHLMVELIANEISVIIEAIRECYSQEICPEWWKLPPIGSVEDWKKLEKSIIDPYCCGVLLFGKNLPIEELSYSLGRIREYSSMIKGFAVGRTIWGEALEKWIRKEWTDQMVIEKIEENFSTLIGRRHYDSNIRN